MDSSRTVGDSEINYTAGLGIGPIFNGTLQPLDLLNPQHPGKIATSVRLGCHPDVGNPEQLGTAFRYARIPIVSSIDPTINVVRRRGVFAKGTVHVR